MMRAVLFLLLAADGGLLLRAESAVLECTRAHPPMLAFRGELIQGWNVTRATLLVHLPASVQPPERWEVAPATASRRRVRLSGSAKGEGWWQVNLPGWVVQPIANRVPGAGLIVRGTPGIAVREQRDSYLLVEGTRAAARLVH